MSISISLKDYLEAKGVEYQLIRHTPTDTAYNAARAAHVPTRCMVKGVLLQDDRGYLMAAVPATRSLDLEELNRYTGRQLQLVEEDELRCILNDCVTGAVPALGEAFGVPTLWDESLAMQPSFYIEAGDHEELVRLGYYAFMALMPEGQRTPLSH